MLDNSKLSLTQNQIDSIYYHTESIISNLDEYALKELTSGTEKDLDNILNVILEETSRILIPKKGPITTHSFDYLDKLTKGIDEELKLASLNYFITSTLPDFEMNWHHIEWGNLVQFNKKLGILAARDHGKSYFYSFAYPLWKMYRYRKESFSYKSKINALNKKGMIITNEFSLASEFLKYIREEIEKNPILYEKLYPNKGEGFGAEEITCKNGASLTIKGSGSALRGRHPSWIVIDDYLDDSVLYSKTQNDKFINDFHSIIMNMIVPGGQVVVVGTPFTDRDLYINLKGAKGWRVFEYPSIYPDGSLLWSNRYTLKDLLEKRDAQGNIIFSREHLLIPISSDSTIFPYHILERSFVGMQEYELAENITSFNKKFKRVVLGCDFAISSSIGADYSVFTTLGVDEYDNYWLLNQWRKKGASYNEQIAVIKRLKANFNHDVIMAEDNAFQQVMIQICKDNGVDVIGHTTGINKYDLKTGIIGLAVLFEQGKIRFPRGDIYSRDVTDMICLEASGITWTDKNKLENVKDHDDTVMSLWIAVKGANYVHSSLGLNFI